MTIKLAVLFLFLGAGAAEAQKTDSVWIRNGDRITGEVKSLSRGLLKYSTDDLGTVYIEWDKVDRISTTTIVEVRLASGRKFYGPLRLAPSGRLLLGEVTLQLSEIVGMTPIQGEFLARLNGYFDLGFSFQKAHNAVQLSTGARVQYRGPGAETTVDLTGFIEDRDDATKNSRLSTALTERLFLSNRWSTGFVIGYDRNDELGLSGRGRLVGFGTRMLAQSNHIEFLGSGGVVLTRERYFTSDTTTTGFEGLLGAAFRAFRYDQPKLDVSLSSQAYPSFTVQGRVRLQSDLRVSYEILKDFMVTGTLFDAYDSKPPVEGIPKNDFGTTLAITWTY
ncbi:MAG TPA: DUF481 domain-containing protein [Gemmatimonadales bacterium]|nr:DUF481 domain-containing protein [Gemmatimonadales bacterium]